MEIFCLNKLLLQFLGLSLTPVNDKYFKCYRWLPHLLMTIVILIIPPLIYHTVDNISNLNDITSTFSILAANIQTIGKLLVLWRRKDDIEIIFDKIQEIVDDCEYASMMTN